jgi:nucleoside-diphosphate-sugar epimerase
MRILITGSTGFLGGRLLRRLAGHHDVFTLSRRMPESGADGGATWLIQDLAQPTWTVQLPDKIDAVVHLAQSPHFRNFPAQAGDIYGVSAGTTMKLLDWALKAGAQHFVLGSTGGLYGSSKTPISESAHLPHDRGQLGFYFAAKRAAELLAQQYAGQLTVATLRFFFIYGAGQPSSMLMPRLAANVRDGKPITLHGDDGIYLNPVHVDDAVNAIVSVMNLADSRLLNIAGPEVTTLRRICEEMGRLLGRRPVFDVDMIAQPNHLVADIERMSRALGAPETGVAAGIAELLGQG